MPISEKEAYRESGMEKIEAESPTVSVNGREVPAWRIPGTKWRREHDQARARYRELRGILPIAIKSTGMR